MKKLILILILIGCKLNAQVAASLQLAGGDNAWHTSKATAVPLVRQMVLNTTTGQYKIGDGVTQLQNLTYYPSLSGYVPYTGATGSVNLGAQSFSTSGNTTIGNYISTSQRQLRVGQGVGFIDFGCLPNYTDYMSIYLQQTTPNDANYSISSNGTGLLLNDATYIDHRVNDALSMCAMYPNRTVWSYTPSTTGAITPWSWSAPANTNQTDASEITPVNWQLTSTQWGGGSAISLNRGFRIRNGTLSATSAKTIANAVTFYVDDNPTAGTNMTLTKSWAIGTAGNIWINSTTAGRGLTAGNAFVGVWSASNSYAAFYHTSVTAASQYALVQDNTGVTFLNSSGTTNISSASTVKIAVTSASSALTNRLEEKQGASVASANNLTLGSDGNVFEITGTTQINLITNTNWQNGSVIKLLFTSTPVVKNGQATSSSNITIKLAGGVDFSATADDVLTLVLSTVGGVQAWREVSRSVN